MSEAATEQREEYLTITEACEVLKVTRNTLRKWRHAGLIESYYPMGKPKEGHPGNVMVRIARSELDRFIKGHVRR